MADCLFCSIVAGDIASDKVYEDELSCAFQDLNPQAPTHVLVVPKRHYADVVALAGDREAAAGLLAGIRATAAQLDLAEFRTVFNTGAQVGQSVFHVHAHLLGGRAMGWPPG